MSRPPLRQTGMISLNDIETHSFMKDGNHAMRLTAKNLKEVIDEMPGTRQ
jgi:hypothetical protein